MKKLLLVIFTLFVMIQSVSAYTPTTSDKLIVSQLSYAIENLIDDKGYEYRDIYVKRLETIKKAYSSDDRIAYIIDQIIVKISPDDILEKLLGELGWDSCVGEWYLVENMWDNPQYCCAGLQEFHRPNESLQVGVGNSMNICYDPQKWEPKCKEIQWSNFWVYDTRTPIYQKPGWLYQYPCYFSDNINSSILKMGWYHGSLSTQSVEVWEEFTAWYFWMKSLAWDLEIEEIHLKQIGSLNWDHFDDVYLKLYNHTTKKYDKVWSCKLNINEECIMNISAPVLEYSNDPNYHFMFHLVTEAETSQGQDTVQFEILNVEVEDDNTGDKATVEGYPAVINLETTVQ